MFTNENLKKLMTAFMLAEVIDMMCMRITLALCSMDDVAGV